MSDKSNIGWTDATWTVVYGCSPVSAGCTHCWSATLAHMRAQNPNPKASARYQGLTRMTSDGPKFTGAVRLWSDALLAPMGWKKPRKIFVCSQSDLFHPEVPIKFVDKVFAVMAMCPQHTFQVLTKRPETMSLYIRSREWHECRRYLAQAIEALRPDSPLAIPANLNKVWPLRNVWLGTSVENQEAADKRIHHLIKCPAAVRFLSCEPLLGPLDLDPWLDRDRENPCRCGDGECSTCWQSPSAPTIGWVIVGGESGSGARPFVCGWGKEIVRQCKAAGVPVFVKQIGSKPTDSDGKWHPKKIGHGTDMSRWPEELRIQQFPGDSRA